MDWKDYTAILGAVTGTVSLALQIFSRRPRFSWAMANPLLQEELRLVIENPSQSSLLITRFVCIPRQYKCRPIRLQDEAIDVVRDTVVQMRTGRTPLLIRPGQAREIEVEELHDGAGRSLIMIVWHRFWFLPIRAVKLVWVSPKIAADIRHGGR
jgi:hypothetical protein